MEIKAVSSFAVTRPAAATAPAQQTQAETGGGPGEAAKTQAGIYISPVVRYDQAAKLAVLFFRDADTGETRDQIPAEKVVEEYRRAGGRSGGDSASGESSTGYERASAAGTADTGGRGATPPTTVGSAGTGTAGTGTGGTGTGGAGTGGGYTGGYGAASGAAVSAGFAASSGGSGGARVSVTV